MSSRLEQLERLMQLKDAGALTAEEFNAEKAKVLGAHVAGPTAKTLAADPIASSSDDGVDEVSWNPFKRPADIAAAERLSRLGFLAGVLMIACDLAIIGNLLLQSLTGGTYEDGTTNLSLLPLVGGVLLLELVIDIGLTIASWRGRSRWAAISLLILSVIAASASLLDLSDGRTPWRILQLVINWGAFFCAIQAVRGAFSLKAMGGLPGLHDQRAESEREMGRVIDAYLPASARRRWLMIVGGIAAVVAAVVVGSMLTKHSGRSVVEATVSNDVAPSPADVIPAPLPPVNPEPILALPPLVSGIPFAQARQQLLAAGLSPMPINLNGECPGDLCQVYPEVMECSGMGSSPDSAIYAPCTLRYRREADGAWIVVRTTGEYLPDYNQDVSFHDMAVMNVQDQATVSEIEGQYATLTPS